MTDVEQPVSVEDQQAQAQSYYDQVLGNAYVQTAINAYTKTKEFHPLLNSTLNSAEEKVSTVGNYAAQKAYDGYNSYYVKPKNTAYEAVSYGTERAKTAVESGKQAAIVGGTFGIGAAVVLTQFSLALSAGGAALVLEQVDSAKKLGSSAISTIKEAELAVEHRIFSALHQAQRIAMVPVEKITENTNSLLDILDGAVQKGLNIEVPPSVNLTIGQRVKNLASLIVQGVSNKAHDHVIDPINERARNYLEQLSQSFVLLDIVREKKTWVIEKSNELSTSVFDFKKTLEEEAQKYKVAPEEMLMKHIQSTSEQLSTQLQSLREKGQNVFGDGTKIDSTIDYLENLKKNFTDAEDVYKVRDEVLNEGRQRIAELSTWTTSLLIISAEWQFEPEDLLIEELYFDAPPPVRTRNLYRNRA
ncbi:Perilipin-1 homolog [Caenorhabditis elegans]|uniref:Isoform a of Perilipin-1 homolog n=1 Tax=Caenorhabditis elegans TaxID=6239 RepID=A8WHP8-2|nr:Perilipin-1 homolog [Caenorhabditis elegans]CAA95854.1 Perilipin-1 homolog [Caenorhabditis elegans]|eukprot:NP_001021646.1 Perilipin-1 homolog [Caenorhabditis elegans]